MFLERAKGTVGTEHEILSDFYRTIWHEEKGYVYLALRNPTNNAWDQRFFEWPIEEPLVIQATLNERASKDVYFAPSIFRVQSSKKEDVLGSFCFWIEFDGTLPVDFGDVPAPSIVVQTSTETHKHIYWCTDQLIEIDRLETVNRSLSYSLQADSSGWDANQVLRPPLTHNHKKKATSKLITKNDRIVNSVAFAELTSINLPPKYEFAGVLPDLSEVVRKYLFSRPVWTLFKDGSGDRSAGLMALGYHLAEMNLTNAEMMSLLFNADKRWGKFADRDDQSTRLAEIVTIARIKYPWKAIPDAPESQVITVGFQTFLAQEIKIEWMWQGLLEKQGYLLLAGGTGVGKSQFSLNFAEHLALGKEFLERAIDRPRKTAFISLEMGPPQLHYFLSLQAPSFTVEEQVELETMLRLYAKGSPTYFNRDEHKLALVELIEREGIECVIFDSLGSMTEQELSKEVDVKNLMDWIDTIRTQYGISVWIIHHLRKGQAGNKNPNDTSDIYGSQYITARASTALIVSKGKRENTVVLKAAKLRLSSPIDPFALVRKNDLTFELAGDKLSEILVDDIDITETEAPATESWGF